MYGVPGILRLCSESRSARTQEENSKNDPKGPHHLRTALSPLLYTTAVVVPFDSHAINRSSAVSLAQVRTSPRFLIGFRADERTAHLWCQVCRIDIVFHDLGMIQCADPAQAETYEGGVFTRTLARMMSIRRDTIRPRLSLYYLIPRGIGVCPVRRGISLNPAQQAHVNGRQDTRRYVAK